MDEVPPPPEIAAISGEVGVRRSIWMERSYRAAGWARRIITFGVWQGLVQLALALAGLLIIRHLPKSEYALFAIANAVQVAVAQLSDLGIGIGVRSIGGKVWNDKGRLGQLIQSALQLRRAFAVAAGTFCFPLLVWLLRRNGASTGTTISLCLVVAASMVPLVSVTVWTGALLLHGEYARVQRLDLSNALLRLALVAGLVVSRINAVLAAVVGTVVNFVQAFFLRRWVQALADSAAPANSVDRAELVRLSKKALPNTAFFCLQGQVTLWILTLVGSPTGIADITALGRLATLFAVFSVMFTNVLAPRFARCQDTPQLRKLYLLLVGGSILTLAPVVVFAAVFPTPLLWLLGAQYANLGRECAWVIAGGCTSQILGVLWSLNSSKAWISIQAVGYIPAIVLAQAIAAICFDLRQFHAVVLFSCVTSAAPIPLMIADAVRGLRASTMVRSA